MQPLSCTQVPETLMHMFSPSELQLLLGASVVLSRSSLIPNTNANEHVFVYYLCVFRHMGVRGFVFLCWKTGIYLHVFVSYLITFSVHDWLGLNSAITQNRFDILICRLTEHMHTAHDPRWFCAGYRHRRSAQARATTNLAPWSRSYSYEWYVLPSFPLTLWHA